METSRSITIHYGTVDGATGNWQQSVSLGQQASFATTVLDGLSSSTLYFFRASASNSGGVAWAPSSASFTTGGVSLPAVVNDEPSGLTGTTANLRGEVTNTGFDPPVVTVYYGGSDGGVAAGAWENSLVLGVRDGDFSAFVTALEPETDYFFRAAATNAAGTVWAPSTELFATTALVPNTVIIHEIHYDPDGVEPEEFVELHNPSDSAIDLSGWTLEGGIDFSFPGGTIIGVGGYLVIAADPATILANFNAAALGSVQWEVEQLRRTHRAARRARGYHRRGRLWCRLPLADGPARQRQFDGADEPGTRQRSRGLLACEWLGGGAAGSADIPPRGLHWVRPAAGPARLPTRSRHGERSISSRMARGCRLRSERRSVTATAMMSR